MNDLLKHQLKDIGYTKGALNESKTALLLSIVDRTYNIADENRNSWEDMLKVSSKRVQKLSRSLEDNVSKKSENLKQFHTHNKISDMLHMDMLTGISNRLHFEVLMEKLLLDNYRRENRFAMLFLDIDHFKHINDTLGHDVGDMLLQQIADAIRGFLEEKDIFSRIGGDEFVLVLMEADDIHLTSRLHTLMELMRQIWVVNGYELKVSASVGIAKYPDDGRNMLELMKNADIAMYHSKNIGRDNFTFFEKKFNKSVHTEMKLIQNMSDALSKGEFVLHYQPKVALFTNEVIGAEALIRWEHPEMGLVYPNQFITLAENTGFILKLGRWVIEEACRSIVWMNRFASNQKLSLCINISIRQFQHENIYQILKDAIQETGIDGSQLIIEITESIMKENNKIMSAKLNEIKSLNVGIALDDFGTGFSTLSCLDKLSIDQLKIDKAFVDAIPENGHKSILLDTIIAMGGTLGMMVIAEGVEHEYQRQYLLEKGCDVYQGYLFSRALPKHEFIKYLQV